MSLWRKQKAAAPVLRTHFAWAVVSLCSAWPADVPNPRHRTDCTRAVFTDYVLDRELPRPGTHCPAA